LTNIRNNAFYNILRTSSTILFQLLSFSYIARILQAENLGKVNFSSSIISYVSLIASLGIATYAVRECSKVSNDKNTLEKTASQIMSINICTTIIAYILLFITLLFVKELEPYRVLIIIQSFSILFATLGADWLNMALEDFRYITLRTIFFNVISIIAIFIFVKDSDDYLIYAVITVVANSGTQLLNILYRRRYCRLKFAFNMDVKRHLRPLLILFAVLVSQTIYTNSGMTMLGIMKGDYDLGIYSVSVRIYNTVNTVIASIAIVVMPKLSFYYKDKDYKNINGILKHALNLIIVLGIPCITCINLITSDIIRFISGSGYQAATTSLHILTITLAASLLGGFIGNLIFLPSSRDSKVFISCFMSAAISILGNLFLIPRLGMNAVAITTTLAEIAGICFLFPQIEKQIQIKGKINMLKAPLVGAVFIVLISIVLRFYIENVYIKVPVIIVVSAIVYLVTLILMKDEFALKTLKPLIDKLVYNNKRGK